MSLNLFSPAKINLFLRVTGRQEDGYHELSTLMQAVDLGDLLSLSLSSVDFFSCSDRTIPCDRTNLVIKALELFRNKTGFKECVHITLKKQIPHQAGLGGGSGNAATILWGLNQLFGKPLLEKTLKEWGVELGADVPFFFSTGTAHCKGIGEIVTPCEMINQTYYLHQPNIGLSTKDVFNQLDLSCLSKEDKLYYNDLEKPAIACCHQLKELKRKLKKYYSQVFMTGSGSGLIGVDGLHPDGIPLRPITRQQDLWYPPPPRQENNSL